MKNPTPLRSHITRYCLMLALAAPFWMPAMAQAQEKGATKLIQLRLIKTEADAAALEPGDAIVMSCPKCKTIMVTYVETEPKGHVTRTTAGEQHLCPGCKGKLVTKGHGKNAKTEYVHVCAKCGSKDAMCCVMKKGQGPTKGMEEK